MRSRNKAFHPKAASLGTLTGILCMYLHVRVLYGATPAGKAIDIELAIVKVVTEGTGRVKPKIREVGTGFIFHEDGFVLTAGHVVKDPDEYESMSDGTGIKRTVKVFRKLQGLEKVDEHSAVVLYYDGKLDLALLRINCQPKCANIVRFGNSSFVTDNASVQAIVWGDREKVETQGQTTVLNACVLKAYCYFKINQTSIKKGDSGGAVFNLAHEVVGMVNSDGADARGDVLLTPINLAAPIRMFADIEPPETKSRVNVVEQSIKTLERMADDLKQNIRPFVEWFPEAIQGSNKRQNSIGLSFIQDFDGQYLPEKIELKMYPGWRVTPSNEDREKTTYMSMFESRSSGLFYTADSDALTIEESIKKHTAIKKDFEPAFRTILKSKYSFTDKTLDTLTISGAEVELKWKLPKIEISKTRTQYIGAAP